MATSGTMGVTSKVLEILEGDPNIPYSTIGDVVGVTRERVRQIAKKNGYPARIGIVKLQPKKICKTCGKTFYTKNLYCSTDCGYKARRKRTTLICQQCGGIIERSPGKLRNKNGNYFCNRACYRNWLLNNSSKTPKKRKHPIGEFKPKATSKSEIFLKGKISASHILKIYNVLLRLSENEWVKISNNELGDFKELGKAIKKRSNNQDPNTVSAIIDIKKHSLLFVMRLTD